MRVLGIDVGLNGALALIEDGQLLEVHDMPTVTLERNSKTKRMVNAKPCPSSFAAARPTWPTSSA